MMFVCLILLVDPSCSIMWQLTLQFCIQAVRISTVLLENKWDTINNNREYPL